VDGWPTKGDAIGTTASTGSPSVACAKTGSKTRAQDSEKANDECRSSSTSMAQKLQIGCDWRAH
jgi:hypothetical protein